MPELFKLFKVKGLLVLGDIFVSEFREFIDTFDKSNVEKLKQSYHRLRKLDEKLKFTVDENTKYWNVLKEYISKHMLVEIHTKFKDIFEGGFNKDISNDKQKNDEQIKIKNKSHDYKKIKKEYGEYEKYEEEMDKQIKADKKLKEDKIRDKLINFFKERKK